MNENTVKEYTRMLKARNIPTNELLEKRRNHQEESKFTFYVSCYPVFQSTKTILEEL